MSYEIVKSLSIRKNGTVNVSCVSNNVYPKQFKTHNITANSKDVFRFLIGGIWQPHTSANGYLWAYILQAIKNDLKQVGLSTLNVYSLDNDNETFIRYHNKFMQYYNNAKGQKKKYIVEVYPNMYVHTVTNNKFHVSSNKALAKQLSYCEAMYYKNKHSYNIYDVE